MPEFSMDRVVEVLKAKGVNAYVEQTGGGCATIFAGVQWTEEGYGTRWSACAGPGSFGWGQRPSTGHTDEFCVGADDMGESPVRYFHEQEGAPSTASEAEVFIAQMVYDRVVEWGVEKVVGMTPTWIESDLREAVTEVFPLPEDSNDTDHYFDLCCKVVAKVQEMVEKPATVQS